MRLNSKFAFLVLALVLAYSPANAADFKLNSSTYLGGLVQPGADDVAQYLPFYEMVQLNAKDFGVSGLSVQASLWGRLNLVDTPLHEDFATGDVNILLMQYIAPRKHMLEGLSLRLGRQFVASGPSAYDQIDGLWMQYKTPWRFSVAGHAGLNTGIRFLRQPWALNQNDLKYGGNFTAGGHVKVFPIQGVTLGASYRHLRYDNEVAFNELGWNAGTSLIPRVRMSTDGTFDLTAERIKELRAMASVNITRKITANGGYRYTQPDLFIPRTSIFAVFSNQDHQEAFMEAHYSPEHWLNFEFDGGLLFFGETCTSGTMGGGYCDDNEIEFRGEIRANMRFGAMYQHRVTLVGERYGAPDGGYTRGRIAERSQLSDKVSSTTSFDVFYLDNRDSNTGYVDISDKSQLSFTASLYVGYAALPNLTILAGGQGGVTPYLRNYAAFTVRLNWLIDSNPIAGPVRVTRFNEPSLSLTGGVLQ